MANTFGAKKGQKGNSQRGDGKCLEKSKIRCSSAKKDVVHLMLMGNTMKDIVEVLMNKYGYTEGSAEDICRKAQLEVESKYTKYLEGVADRNVRRLEAIIDETYDGGQTKLCLEAIDLLNKTCQVYQTKINVKTDEPVKIEFN